MATRKRRRRATKARKPRETLPSPPQPPPARTPGPLEQKLRAVGERLLDIAAEDPERVFRMGEGVVNGVNDLYQLFQKNPDAVRRTVRNTVTSAVAKMAKKKLKEQ